jgi:HAD superfamily hydrolase (TIGR01509 family)
VISALILDFDGLIVDTETPDFESWRLAFAEHGAELTLAEWSECVGREYGFIDPHAILEGKIGREIDRAELKAWRKPRFKEMLASQPVLPGVVDYLDGARGRGIRTAVASSAPRRWVQPKLERLGLAARFDCVKCEEDAPAAKPAPDLFLAAAEALGAEPEKCIAFEDSPNGVLAAKRAGMFCVAVPNAITRQLKIEGADLTVDSLADLPLQELIERATSAD